MHPPSPQRELFARPIATPGTVFVNDRVCVPTEEEQRVVFVHGIIFSHYAIEDRTAEAYAMVTLFESGYADQNDIARCFGYSARSFRRYQERLKTGGLGGSSAVAAQELSNSRCQFLENKRLLHEGIVGSGTVLLKSLVSKAGHVQNLHVGVERLQL